MFYFKNSIDRNKNYSPFSVFFKITSAIKSNQNNDISLMHNIFLDKIICFYKRIKKKSLDNQIKSSKDGIMTRHLQFLTGFS